MNVRIIGIIAVIGIVIIAGVGLAMTQDPWYDDDWDDLPDDTAGMWRTELKAVLEDGSTVSIPINGNALQAIPLSLSYSGQVITKIQYIISVVAEDPSGYYDTVEVRPIDTPHARMVMQGPNIWTQKELYPFSNTNIPVDGQPHTIKMVEFNMSDYNEADAGTYTMWTYLSGGDFQYKLPDETDWTTAPDPTDIFFEVTVDHAGEFTISFVATTNPQ